MTVQIGLPLRRYVVATMLMVMAATLAAAPAFGQTAWSMATPLPTPMGEIMGTVVGDKWYVMGGLDMKVGGPIGAVYVFDPSSNTWAARKPMAAPAHHIMTAALNGKIYVMGGFVAGDDSGAWKPTNRSWEYDPATDLWTELPPLPTPRGAGYAVESNGKIYVIGGAQANFSNNPAAPFTPGTPQLVLGTMEEYDPATRHWRTCASMPTPRNHFLAGAVNGKIYAIGGRLGSAMITVADDTNVIEEFDPLKDAWADKGRAPIRRSGMAGGTYRGRIYVAGGEYQDWEGAKAFWAVQAYDPSSGRWEDLPRMQLAHHGFAAGFLGDTLHVVGGGFQSDGMPGVNTKTAVHEFVKLRP
jgi:N-acetylneuraminic acid mutarotase